MALSLIKRLIKGSPLSHAEMDENWTKIENEFTGKANTSHTHPMSAITGLVAELAAKLSSSARGAVNGVASLGADGKVPLTQLPPLGGQGYTLMPKADSVTVDDVGKVCRVNDDGEIEVWQPLPNEPAEGEWTVEFVRMTEKEDPAISITPNIPFFENPQNLDTFTINYNAIDGDPLTSVVFTFKTTPVGDTDVEIGVDIDQTIENLSIAFWVFATTNSLTDRLDMAYAPLPTGVFYFFTGNTSEPNESWSVEFKPTNAGGYTEVFYANGSSGTASEVTIGTKTLSSFDWNVDVEDAEEEAAAFAAHVESELGDKVTVDVTGAVVTITANEVFTPTFPVTVDESYPSNALDLTEVDSYVAGEQNFFGYFVAGVIKEVDGSNCLIQTSGVAELTYDPEEGDGLTLAAINAGLEAGVSPSIFKLVASSNGTVQGVIVLLDVLPEELNVEVVSGYFVGVPLQDCVAGEPVKVMLSQTNIL